MGLTTGKFIGPIFQQETPAGTVNGANTAFTLSKVPHSDGAVILMIDGIPLEQGAGAGKYTLSGVSITMGTAPANGQSIYAWYVHKD